MARKRTVAITTGAIAATIGLIAVPLAVRADQVIPDDLIVQGSLCAGLDCVNGESFGFDTIRLKENNLRIRAFDTSSTASFPTVDWQLTFNDTTNGGANKFSIDNIDRGTTPFTIRDGAPTNAVFVDSGGRLGLKTGTPVLDLHIVNGNTPGIRLEQNGSSGFTPQTWDVSGNEANFFIRDVTGGSQLPFRIEPGADTNSLVIDATNSVGIGTNAPIADLDVTSDQDIGIRIFKNSSTENPSFALETAGGSNPVVWRFNINRNNGRFNFVNPVGAPLKMGPTAVNDLLRVGIAADNVVDVNGLLQLVPSNTAPAVGPAGSLYVDSAPSHTLCLSNGTTWTNLGATGNCA